MRAQHSHREIDLLACRLSIGFLSCETFSFPTLNGISSDCDVRRCVKNLYLYPIPPHRLPSLDRRPTRGLQIDDFSACRYRFYGRIVHTGHDVRVSKSHHKINPHAKYREYIDGGVDDLYNSR